MSKELIERLREAAAQRVASTAMIGADDLIAADDALESLDAAYSGAVEAGKALAKQALKAERDRDAFEKAAGEEAKKYLEEREKRIAAEAERDALAAELKALREQEPVGWIERDDAFDRPFANLDSDGNLLQDMTNLYTRPVPVCKLTDKAICDLWIEADDINDFGYAIERYLKGEGE